SVTANGGITFTGYDDFYHMRRILYTASNFPHSLNFDSYLNYPSGFEVGWPPFFDLLGALFAKVLGGGQSNLYAAEFAGALLPVLLGILTIIPLYVLASTVFDRKTGLLAASIFAVLPAHIYISRFGALDHHVAETLLSTAAYAFYILALKSAGEGSFSLASLKALSSEKGLIKSLTFAGLSGLFFALLIFTWAGAPIFVSFVVLYAFIQTTIDLKAGKKSDYLFICSLASIFATLLFTIPLSAGAVRPGLELSATYLSWFQVFYILSLLAATFLLWGFSSYISKKALDWKYYPAVLIIVLGASLLSLRVFSAESYAYMVEGFRFFSGKGEYIGTIAEALPLFLNAQGKLALGPVLGTYGLCFIAALIALFLLGLELKGENSKPEGIFFFLWAVFFAYLAISQRRFSYLFAVNVSILTAYLLWVLLGAFDFEPELKKLVKSKPLAEKNVTPDSQTGKGAKSKSKSKLKTKNVSIPKKKEEPDYFKIASSIVLIGLIFVPCIWLGASFAKTAGSVDPEWKDSLSWLKTSTPETSYYFEPSKPPEYGVLSWWDYGNWIVYLSKRPVVSNNFQTGVQDSALFFTTDSEQEAKAVMDKRNIKYVITDKSMASGKFGAIVELAGKNISDYYDIKTVSGKAGLETVATAKNEFLNTEIYKLNELDGSNLGNLRLIHESTDPARAESQKSNVKIFEYVPGARLSGTASPNQPVAAKLELSSNTGRKFTYQNEAVAGKNGAFEITVPYPTENKNSGVKASSVYSLSAGENVTISEIQVSENDVLKGNKVEVKISESK
ncbi:MAG TPA: oligosaccharyl transferase, archaeosortase A system-associated, partial [Methanosarcina sp.]|nr:oligosaccharyl transferase, archaeosortase A system-associated [Methanosarcina sp.]